MTIEVQTLPVPRRREGVSYRALRGADGRGVVLCERPADRLAAGGGEAAWPLEWGHHTRGARHLAWTLLFDASGSRSVADDWCGSFCEEVVARLPAAGFVLDRRDIESWLDASPEPRAAPPYVA